MKNKLIGVCLFSACALCGYETIIESDEVRYNGELIILTGNLAVENTMGRITAKIAHLKKDPERTTSIDFPWIELKHNVTLSLSDGGTIECETVFLDYTQKTSFFYGDPQVIYKGSFGEIYADKAQIDYQEIDGGLEATQVTLFDNVRLVNKGDVEKPAAQYALAESVCYFPKEKLTLLEGKKMPVLFYDQLRDMQLSAYTVRAQKDPETKKETIQGVGEVRFVFKPDELEKIKQRFPTK